MPGASVGVLGAVDALYRFSRPHTIRGTLLACFTGVGRALLEAPQFLALLPALLPRAMLGVLALLLGNLFIVGLNQIYDVEIDVVNKPFLPIAAGRLSPQAAWTIVLGSGAAALGIVHAIFSPHIFGLFAFGTIIGGLYSVPPIQLKRFPLGASLLRACVLIQPFTCGSRAGAVHSSTMLAIMQCGCSRIDAVTPLSLPPVISVLRISDPQLLE